MVGVHARTDIATICCPGSGHLGDSVGRTRPSAFSEMAREIAGEMTGETRNPKLRNNEQNYFAGYFAGHIAGRTKYEQDQARLGCANSSRLMGN